MAKVVLSVNGVDLVFNPTMEDHTKFINSMQLDNKVAPSVNYLRRIVDKDSKEALNELLTKSPGAALQLVSVVNDEFAPELEITVKK